MTTETDMPRYWQRLRAEILAKVADDCVICRTTDPAPDPVTPAVPAEPRED